MTSEQKQQTPQHEGSGGDNRMHAPAVVMGNVPEPRRSQVNRFFAVAEALLLEHGYQATTVAMLCEAARLPEEQFRELFGDKAGLFVELALAIARQMVERWQGKPDETINSSQRLADFLRSYVTLRRERRLMNLLFSEHELMREVVPRAITVFRTSPLAKVARALIEQGQRRGEFVAQDPETAMLMVFSVVNHLLFALPPLQAVGMTQPNDERTEQVLHFVIRGLGGTLDETV